MVDGLSTGGWIDYIVQCISATRPIIKMSTPTHGYMTHGVPIPIAWQTCTLGVRVWVHMGTGLGPWVFTHRLPIANTTAAHHSHFNTPWHPVQGIPFFSISLFIPILGTIMPQLRGATPAEQTCTASICHIVPLQTLVLHLFVHTLRP